MTESGILFDIRNSLRRRKTFYLSLCFVLFLFLIDILTIGSFLRSFFGGGVTDEFISTLVLEDWFACFENIFLIVLYVALLAVMSVRFLRASFEDEFRPEPFLLLWHSSLGLICAVADLGHCFLWKSYFVNASDGMKSVMMLPILLCFVYWIRRYDRVLLPLAALSGLTASVCLILRSFGLAPGFLEVLQTVDDILFLVCAATCLVFALIDRQKGNAVFRRLPVLLAVILSLTLTTLGLLFLFGRSAPEEVRRLLLPEENILHSVRLEYVHFLFLLTVLLLMAQNALDEYFTGKLEEKALETRYAANEEYAENVHRYEQSVRELKHDLSHQMQMASVLCREGKYEELGNYLDSLTEGVSARTEKVFCAHTVTNYLLQMFDRRFSEKGIAFHCEAHLPWELNVSDRDLLAILNNLLQNALEAAEQAPEDSRWVQARLSYEGMTVRFHVRNSYGKEPVRDGKGNIGTLKADRKAHGLGLGIIRKTAEAAGGAANFSYGNGIFEAKVVLPVTEG